MVDLKGTQYGVVYYFSHTMAHVCSRFLIHVPAIHIDLERFHSRRVLLGFTSKIGSDAGKRGSHYRMSNSEEKRPQCAECGRRRRFGECYSRRGDVV
jgi:hypothetical protein